MAMNSQSRPLTFVQIRPYAARDATVIGMIVAGMTITNEFTRYGTSEWLVSPSSPVVSDL